MRNVALFEVACKYSPGTFLNLFISITSHARTHSTLVAVMRQHLHNSVLSSRALEAKRRTNIPTQDPVNGDEVNEGVFVLGNATLEVVAPLDFYLFIHLFI